MTMNEPASSVTAFFESYRLAFERLDAPAIAEHFAYPSHITSDTGQIVLIPIASQPQWTAQIEQLLGMYRAIGFRSASVLNLALTELSPRLVQVLVHWALYGDDAGLLYDFQALYTLATINTTLRITTIAHNELVRYREYVVRLQSQQALGTDSGEGSEPGG
jgi:hypothetical protein